MSGRLAIIGCGSSGLVTLKTALDTLPDWEIVCFEKSDSIVGCWGNPYPGFVSTSTKYTTQFACFPICDASVVDDAGKGRHEFFRDDEYGQYLESFADQFGLCEHIQLNSHVEELKRVGESWQLIVDGQSLTFDAVVICTGLAAKPKRIDCEIEQLSAAQLNHPDGLSHITQKKIVVVGGGESAVDYANRLANADLGNEVLLSLHSGVRVSPRYHPVRGVPSDFLRNRLMLSVDPDIRNGLGQIFVELRIKYESLFRRLFPGQPEAPQESDANSKRRKEWTLRLTVAAKDDLFSMFHNKSDDFLEAVGDQRIRIVGGPTDGSWSQFSPFADESDAPVDFLPDLIVPGIGFESTIGKLAQDQISLPQFYLGCCHVEHPDLFLVGFARPIIGNIPTISEMQSRLVCGLIAKEIKRPANIQQLQEADHRRRSVRYSKLNLDLVFPVEMFPYCDRLASLMGRKAGRSFVSSPSAWWQTLVSPATTLHYVSETNEKPPADSTRYMPATLVAFILFMKPVDWIWKVWKWIRPR